MFTRILILIGILMPILTAQSYSWRNVVIGGGGFVTGTVFHPSEPGLVYTRTDVGGIYRLDSSTHRWIPLNDDIGGLNNEFQHLGVLSIGLDPGDPNKVYIATGQYGGTESWKLPSRIYRSTDRGNTWTYTTQTFKMAGNGEGRGTAERIAVDPLNGANLLIGTSNDGIWRSTNSGASWTRITTFTPTNLNFVLYAPANHANPGPARRAYASANTLTGQSFWQSDDNGTTWTEVPNHPGKTPGAPMMPLQASFDAAGVLYSTWADATGPSGSATNYGVWKLSANASTWTSILPPTGQGYFSGISADPRTPGHVITSTLLRWWPGDEIYRSTDGGSTWTAALRTATRSAGNSPWSAAIGPHWITDVDIDPFNSNRAIFNTGFGLFQSTNLSTSGTARTWTFFNDGLEELVPLSLCSPTAGPPLVSVTGDYTGFRHDDLTRSPLRGRHAPGNGSNNFVTSADLAPTHWIRQNSSDTLYSQNAAASWTAFPSSPPPTIISQGRAILSSDAKRIIWCPPNSPAYLSTDNGTSWTPSATAISLVSTTGTHAVSILAGSAGTPGTTNATAGDARFNLPSAIAIAPSGIRFVADSANHTIRRITANGGVSTFAGTATLSGSTDATSTSARFNSPSGIFVDAANTLFVSDTANHTIRRITSAGVVTTLAGSPTLPGSTDATGTAARFNSPTGITADSSGNFYICDTANHTIRKISPTGIVTTFAGSPGSPGSTNANGPAARFSSPRGITIDASGNLLVADSGNHAIRRISPTADVSTFAGSPGTSGSTDATGTAARFNTPKGISIDSSGTCFVTDSGNHTIRRISPTAVVTTIAGLPGSSGTSSGTGSTARFNDPSGIAVTPDGINLYIADTANHTIRRTTPYNTLLPLADRVDPLRIYLWDNSLKRILTSSDGGLSFTTIASNVNSAFTQFRTVPGKTGHIWARAGASGLFLSTNFGATFTKVSAVAETWQFDFGKAAPSATYPAIFIWGKIGSITGFFRSDDSGGTWARINDNLRNFGYQNDIAGDPRVYGRLYLATSGRGVIYGDFASPAASPSQPSQTVFDDTLNPAWTHSSPAGTSLTATSPVYRGSSAISVPSGSASSFAITSTPRSLRGFSALTFWLSAGSLAPPPLQLGASRGGIPLEAVPLSPTPTIGWQRITIPFSSLGISDIDDLTAFRIESRTLNSVTPAAFFIDDLVLVGTNDFNGTPPAATVTLSGLAATYDGSPKPVTATTQPPNLSVNITYNGSSTIPTAAGSYLVSASVNDPVITGSTTGTLIIAKASATIILENMVASADGNAKAISTTTSPPGLPVTVAYNGATTVPTLAGSYNVIASITDPNYSGTAAGTFILRQPPLPPTDLTDWYSNIPGKVTDSTTATPLLNPNDTSDSFSTNSLQAPFPPITLANTGDKITLTGSFQLTAPGISGQGNWIRFGLFDQRGQLPTTATGWLGYTGMGSSLFERTGDGFFSTGTGATQRTPDPSPPPVSANSPSGTPPVAFEETITRTSSGVIVTHSLRRTDTNALLMNYTFSDSSPNNNGLLTGASSATNGYNPTYTTAGFAFGRSYIGTTGAQARFANIKIAFSPGDSAASQLITFPPPPEITTTSPPTPLIATASSGLPVSLAILSGPATLSGNTLTPTGAGTVQIRASQTGNLAFFPAPDVDRFLTISKSPASITLANLTHTYDGSAKTPSVTTLPAQLPTVITYDGSLTPPSSVGSYSVTVTIDHPSYQGTSTGTLLIAPASQSITFADLPTRTFGTAPFTLSATSSSGLPVTFTIASGPASLTGSTLTLEGAGSVVVRASQPGDANFLPAPVVEKSFTILQTSAIITLSGLEIPYTGLPKPVITTTTPPNLPVVVTYAGASSPPTAPGSYPITATIDDPDYTGTTSATFTIANRFRSFDLTSWTTTSSSLSDALTASPLWNPDNLNSGLAGSTHAFFTPIPLNAVGDSITLTGTIAVAVNPNSRPATNQSLWFRFGLFRHQTPVSAPSPPLITDWLGYCGMAGSTSALYERTGPGFYSSPTTGATLRTPQITQTGANSTNSSVNLRFTQSITRTSTGVDVAFNVVNPDTSARIMAFTYSDPTPNNHGSLSGSENSPSTPPYIPTYSAAGFAFGEQYIGSSNASARFSNVQISFSSPTPGTPQSITFPPLADRAYSPAPIPLPATSSSGLPISYSVVSGSASIQNASLILTGIGEVVVRASQDGDDNWFPAPPVEQSFTVTKAPATVSLSNLENTYDGLPKPAHTATSPPNLRVEIFYNDSPAAPYQVGTYDVTAIITDDFYEGSASGTLVIQPPRSLLDDWRFTHFQSYDDLGNAANSADPDGDDIPNLMEFALGLSPTSPSTLPTALTLTSGHLEFTYTRAKNTAATLAYSVEYCDNLSTGLWRSDGIAEISPPVASSGTTETIKTTIPAPTSKRFVRLKVVISPPLP